MTVTYHQILCFTALTIAALGLPEIVAAQPYPNRPLRIIVPFPPGSGADAVSRILGNKLTEHLGQPIIVDARPGASGVIAVEIAKSAPPDGHTLLMAGFATFALLPALKPRLPYDPDKDFVALSRIASGAYVVAVHPSLDVRVIADLVRLAKTRPGQFNYGSSGNGSVQHLAGEMFNVLAGIKTVHVPYKGAVLALNDLIAGQLQFTIASPVIVMPHAKTARIKVIATTGAKLDPLLPELPIVADIIPGFEITSWNGVVLPAKTPAPILDKLHIEIMKAMQTPEMRELLGKQHVIAHAESRTEFTAFIKAERERITRVGRQAGITLD